MKALILAAGYATRLYPITLNKAKPLLKIGGRPIIGRIIEKIKEVEEIDEIFIVTNNKFTSHFERWIKGYDSGVKITVVNDGTLSNEDRLGAIGDMNFVIKNKDIDEDLLVIAGDTLFDLDLNDLVGLRAEKDASIKVVKEMDKSKIAGRYGNLIADEEGKILEFEEKPAEPKSNFASVPIYLFKKEDLAEVENCIKENPALDNSGDFIKYLITKKPMYVYVTTGRRYDIGSKEDLIEADIEFGGTGEEYKEGGND